MVATSSIRWCHSTETWEFDKSSISQDAKHQVLVSHGRSAKKVLVCYCVSALSSDTLLCAYGYPIADGADEPYHAANLPFPFQLPVYPKKDIWFLTCTGSMDRPFLLSGDDRIPKLLEAANFSMPASSIKEWCETIVPGLAPTNGVYSALQEAFDAHVFEGQDDDFVEDDDVATDLLLQSSATAALASAGAASVAPSIAEDDWNEGEEDASFIVEPTMEEMLSSENDDDGGDDEDEDENGDDDDDDEEEGDGDDDVDDDDGGMELDGPEVK